MKQSSWKRLVSVGLFLSVQASLISSVTAQLTTSAAKVKSDGGCVNFREEPLVNSTVIACLEPETHVEVYRIPPTGRFVWAETEGRIWYNISVPSLEEKGWIAYEYLELGG